MNRRTYLRAAGSASAVIVSGCLDALSDPEAANEFGYETARSDDIDVPLVPVEDAFGWYRDDEAVFADARSAMAYRQSRIVDAVFSPAPGGQYDDPVEALPEDTRVVTYCGCPHTLATRRGASLIREGYVHTYAIDEGFGGWVDAGYPIEGENVDATPPLFEVVGETDGAYAGELAWIRHEPTGQREAAPIDGDGRFSLHVRFYEVTSETPVELSTPAGDVTEPLGTLAARTVEL